MLIKSIVRNHDDAMLNTAGASRTPLGPMKRCGLGTWTLQAWLGRPTNTWRLSKLVVTCHVFSGGNWQGSCERVCISLRACTYVCTCTAAERGEPKTGERVVCNGADTRPHPTKIGYMSSRSYNTASNLAFVHDPRSKHLWISSRCWWQDSVLK